MGAIGGLSTSAASGLSVPATLLYPIAAANIEQELAFPDFTKYFRIFNDGKYVAKASYQVTESGSNYIPIYPGDDLKVYGIVAKNVKMYLQSPGLIDLRLEIWT